MLGQSMIDRIVALIGSCSESGNVSSFLADRSDCSVSVEHPAVLSHMDAVGSTNQCLNAKLFVL